MKIIIKLLICLSLVFMVACQKGEEIKKQAKLVYCPWEEGVALTHLVKVVLEDELDYEVEIISADVGVGFVSIAQEQGDAFMETWPQMHKDYINKYIDKFEFIGPWYKNTTLGLAVPKYIYDAGVKNISDLAKPEFAKKFDHKIVGIDAGAGVMKTLESHIMPLYGLDSLGYKLQPSSSPAMLASLQKAIDSKEWIVVPAWTPHTMFKHFDLEFLKEDLEPYWLADNIMITVNKKLSTEKPELHKFLENIIITDAQLLDLMDVMGQKDKKPIDVAREWKTKNPELVKQWVGNLKK